MPNSSFSFLPINERPKKPRKVGLTEVRGPYYSAIGMNTLSDVFETMGEWIDGLKFAGGSFALMPERQVMEMIELAHRYDIYVSTGGWIERILSYGAEHVDRYIRECKNVGFDMIEISCGFITLPTDDFLRIVENVTKAGLKAKPELGIQFGAGGATQEKVLESQGTRSVDWLIQRARRCLDAGAEIIMIESEGITENVSTFRNDIIDSISNSLGTENIMFEASDPEVFEMYVRTYGSDVNLFVDYSQIVQLECLRSGIWGTAESWGRILTYKPETKIREAKKSA